MQHIIVCNLYLITFFVFAKSQLSSKRPPVFYSMMDLVQAAIPTPPGTARKIVQVALRPNPSQKLAISFTHTQRVLSELHGVQTASSSQLQNVDSFMYCFNKSYIKIRGADAAFHRAEPSICITQCWGFMVDLINKPVYVCETLAVRRLCKSMIVMFGDSPLSLKPHLTPKSIVYTCKKKTSLRNL